MEPKDVEAVAEMGFPNYKCARFAFLKCILYVALLVAAMLFAVLAAGKAYAVPIAGTSIASGQTGVSTSIGSIGINFGNNVAADAVFSQNAGHISLLDSNGAVVAGSSSVYRLYEGEGAPDADNPDSPGYRRWLYISVPELRPGEQYTLVVTPGVTSIGNHYYDGTTVTFTTAGTPEVKPPQNPETETPPAPVVPDMEGEGGSGGSDGSSSVGGGADNGGASASTSVGIPASSDVAQSPDDGSGLASEESAALRSADSLDASAETSDAAPDAGSEASAAGAGGLAAGEGGGSVYYLGETGLKPGEGQKELFAPPEYDSRAIGIFLLAVVALVVAGAIRRMYRWRRHTAHPNAANAQA